MSQTRDALGRLDDALGVIEQAAFPNPVVVRKAIRAARDTLANLIQDMDELTARVGLIEEEQGHE